MTFFRNGGSPSGPEAYPAGNPPWPPFPKGGNLFLPYILRVLVISIRQLRQGPAWTGTEVRQTGRVFLHLA